MYFEIYDEDKLIKRGRDALNTPSWSNELMFVPSTTLVLPIYYREFLDGHNDVKIFINDKCFWGIILKLVEDKDDETITVYLEHKVHEWTFRQISVNNAIKDNNINFVFKGSETGTDGNTSVSASSFVILLEEIGAFTDSQYIQRAGASAWTKDGETATVSVDASAIKSEEGEYDVVFSSGGASVTVQAEVKENADEVERDDYTLTASNFSISADKVASLTAKECIRLANAKIEPSLELEVDFGSVKAVDGDYTVKFSAKYEKEDEETGEVTEEEISISVTCVVSGDNDAEATVADNIADIFADMNFAYPGWALNYSGDAGDYTIDYVYSRQNKLEALTKTMELTEDLFWRVRFVNRKIIDISRFGDRKDWMLSLKPSGPNNTRIVGDLRITHDFEHVINLATVYSEKSDTGMSSMTLREIYEDASLQSEGFPVVILRANVNNERDYRKYTQYPKLAPNNWLEYAVIDEESVALENGTLIEGTYAFNDLSPFAVDAGDITREVTDADRIEAAKTAYHAAIKKLKQARRVYEITLTTEQLPADINPGDRVRFLYNNSLYIMDECSEYLKKILSYDDWFVVTRIDYDFDDTGVETNRITLAKEIRIDRETSTS